MTTMKTYAPRANEVERQWFVVDATDQTLGRLASRVAAVLKGKHKPIYQPNLDVGDHVIVVNAARVSVSGDKRDSKVYYRHTNYPRGLRSETLGHLLARRPEEAIRRAVRGMLPHNRLGAEQLRHLKIYAGEEHPHQSQRPEQLPEEEKTA
jgi:large subunit ribosomal protein L13